MQVLVHTRTTLHASNVGLSVDMVILGVQQCLDHLPKNDILNFQLCAETCILWTFLSLGRKKKKIIHHIIVPFAKRSEKLK